MKTVTILCVVAALCAGAPQDPQVLRYDSENAGIDGYNFAYETSDGRSRQEEGMLDNPGSENDGQVAGDFSYQGPDGVQYTVTYTAGPDGYQPARGY